MQQVNPSKGLRHLHERRTGGFSQHPADEDHHGAQVGQEGDPSTEASSHAHRNGHVALLQPAHRPCCGLQQQADPNDA